jgi:tripartite-type tricarboxylate transporter receptor subunit TctC
MDRRQFLRQGLALCAGAALAPRAAFAQAYPTRPVRVVVPFTAGGTTDFTARVICEKMGQIAGHNFIVENKTGAAGVVGVKDVAGAQPDGYSLLFSDSSLAVTPTTNPGAKLDPLKMLQPICLVGVFPSVLIVNRSVPAKTVGELVDYIKANPGKVNFGSGGIGTVPHLQGEQFKLTTGAPLTHVPYRGAAAALQDVVGGQIQMLFTAAPTALAFIQSGDLKLLATTGAERLPALADAPTLAEAGYKDLVSAQWFGLLAPAKLPAEILTRLTDLLLKSLDDPATAKRITDQGGFLQRGTPDDFGRYIDGEIKRWREVIVAAKL